MRTTRYLRQVPPGAPPRPTGDRPVTPLDIRSHAVRADTGEVTTIADIAAAAHKLTCKDAPTLGLQYRVTEQCFERDAAEPRDIVKASPTLHIPNEVGPVDQRHLTRKFQLGFTAMPQGKPVEQCPAWLERCRPHPQRKSSCRCCHNPSRTKGRRGCAPLPRSFVTRLMFLGDGGTASRSQISRRRSAEHRKGLSW